MQINFRTKTIRMNLPFVGTDAGAALCALELGARAASSHPLALEERERGGATVYAGGTLDVRDWFAIGRPAAPCGAAVDPQAPPREPAPLRGGIGGIRVALELGVPLEGVPTEVALRDVDGLVFVADARPEQAEANRRAVDAVEHALRAVGLEPTTTAAGWLWSDPPGVEAPSPATRAELEAELNRAGWPSAAAALRESAGVSLDDAAVLPLRRAVGQLFESLDKRYCSCMFDPEQLPALGDVAYEVRPDAVSTAVTASASRPRA